MAMLKPSQSHSGGVIVKPYTGNIAQELQFLSGEDRKKKNNPILRLGSPWQPSKNDNFPQREAFGENKWLAGVSECVCVRYTLTIAIQPGETSDTCKLIIFKRIVLATDQIFWSVKIGI